jgi:hypothetical protein
MLEANGRQDLKLPVETILCLMLEFVVYDPLSTIVTPDCPKSQIHPNDSKYKGKYNL